MSNLAITKPRTTDALPKRPVGIRLGNSSEARARRCVDIAPGNLIGLWGNYEAGGTQATDLSGNDLHGTHAGVDLTKLGPDGFRSSGEYDGATRYTNVFSARLAGMFVGNEITMMQWWRGQSATWSGAGSRALCYFLAGSTNNRFYLAKVAANQMRMYTSIGGTDCNTYLTINNTDWHWLCLTYSYSRKSTSVVLDGVPLTTTPNGAIAAWTGALTEAWIGSTSAAGGFWLGQIELSALYNRALTLTDMLYIARGL